MAHLISPNYPPGTSPGEVLPAMLDESKLLGASGLSLFPHSLHIFEHVRQVEAEADYMILLRVLLCDGPKRHMATLITEGPAGARLH